MITECILAKKKPFPCWSCFWKPYEKPLLNSYNFIIVWTPLLSLIHGYFFPIDIAILVCCFHIVPICFVWMHRSLYLFVWFFYYYFLLLLWSKISIQIELDAKEGKKQNNNNKYRQCYTHPVEYTKEEKSNDLHWNTVLYKTNQSNFFLVLRDVK